jgi:hypothetical protein
MPKRKRTPEQGSPERTATQPIVNLFEYERLARPG